MEELWFLRSARRLMLIDINMKFRNDSLIGFQVIERTRFCDRFQLKSINASVMVLAFCILSSVDWYLYEIPWK